MSFNAKLQMEMKNLQARAQWMEHCNGIAKGKVPDNLLTCKDAELYTDGFVLFVHDSQKDNGEANYSPSEHSLSEEMMVNWLGIGCILESSLQSFKIVRELLHQYAMDHNQMLNTYSVSPRDCSKVVDVL